MSQASTMTGACLCGGFRFAARGEPTYRAYCHCVDCRRSTGAPVSMLVGYRSEEVEFTGEEPEKYRSSEGVTRAFCGACGGSVSYEDERLPGEIHLHAGLFDDPESFPPLTHSWHSQAIGWLRIEDQLSRHERSSRPR